MARGVIPVRLTGGLIAQRVTFASGVCYVPTAPLCESCAETEDHDVPGTERENGSVLCDNCCDRESEAAYERMLENYYGGSGPQTIQEHYDAAVKERRELRRLD